MLQYYRLYGFCQYIIEWRPVTLLWDEFWTLRNHFGTLRGRMTSYCIVAITTLQGMTQSAQLDYIAERGLEEVWLLWLHHMHGNIICVGLVKASWQWRVLFTWRDGYQNELGTKWSKHRAIDSCITWLYAALFRIILTGWCQTWQLSIGESLGTVLRQSSVWNIHFTTHPLTIEYVIPYINLLHTYVSIIVGRSVCQLS